MDNAKAAYAEVFNDIIPEVVEFFKGKTRDYEGGPAFMLLGSRGQFADMNRKFWKLYQAMWEGKTLEGEQPEEILMDFAGHVFLSIYCLRSENRSPLFNEIMSDLDSLETPLHGTIERDLP